MRNNEKQMALVFDTIISLLGIIGTMGCFLNMFPLPVSMPLLIILMGCTIGFFLYIYSNQTNHRKLVWISVAIYIVIALLTFSRWKNGLFYTLNTILRVYESNSQYNFNEFAVSVSNNHMNETLLPTLWLIFTPMCAFIIRSLRGRHSYFLAFITSAPFLFAILLFTLIPHTLYFMMILMFWFALLGMAYASRYDSHQVASTIQKLGTLFAISALLVMMVIQVLVPKESYVRDAKIESIRLGIQTGIRNMMMPEVDVETGVMDLRTARNRMYIGSNELSVTMEEPQSMYLHGFSGTIYENNTWKTPDENFFNRLYNFDRQSNVYPYNFIWDLQQKERLKVKTQSFTLQYLSDAKDYLYTPYHAMGDYRKEYPIYQDAYIPITDSKQEEYTFQYADLTDVNESLLKAQKETAYYQNMKELYLEVPENIQEVMGQMVIPELTQELDRDTKIKRIKEAMQGFGTYTLSPGDTPEGEDFISYFLLENQEGYCVHYATAATMMLRYYGIPARYASGYRIHKQDFEGNTANVKDYHAHAWAEVLDPILGWVPLEVTPSSSSSINDDEQSGANPNPSNPSQNNNPTQTPTMTPKDPNKITGQTETVVTVSQVAIVGAIIAGIVLILFLPVRRMLKKKRRDQEMHQKNRKLAILSCGTYLDQCKVYELPEEIEAILTEAKYSKHPMSEEQHSIVIAYCEQIKATLYKQGSLWEKFKKKFIECL